MTPAEPAVAPPEPLRPASSEPGIPAFAEALPDPCFILDRRGIVRYANARAAGVFPIRPGDALTARLRVPDLLAAFERVAKGGPPERVEFAERVPTERWFAAWFASLDTADRSIALILDDLSERRRTEKIRVDFVANASHELRTPLASLVGFIETLQGPARDDQQARERFLKIMHDQGTRMSRLVDDLLSLSRVEMKAHLRPSGEGDLVAILRQLVVAMEPLAPRPGRRHRGRTCRTDRWSSRGIATSSCRCSRTSSRTPANTASRASASWSRSSPIRATAAPR